MRNLLSGSRGLAVDAVGKKPRQMGDLATYKACSILCRVDNHPAFTPFSAHVLQVTFHCQNRHILSVISLLLPTINTPNKSDNKLNNLHYC
jgi:hypothetical protein